MATLQEILARAQALREETALGSISPERAGSIMYDTLQQINQMQLEGGSLVISKIYESVAAMQADTAPVSDLTGQDLRQGQLVVIVPSDTSSSDLGSVYRYNGTTEGASSWSFTGKIGGYPMDQTPTQGSTRAVTSGGVYEQITQLGQEVTADVSQLEAEKADEQEVKVNLLGVDGLEFLHTGNLTGGSAFSDYYIMVELLSGCQYKMLLTSSVIPGGKKFTLTLYAADDSHDVSQNYNVGEEITITPSYNVVRVGIYITSSAISESGTFDFTLYHQGVRQEIAQIQESIQTIENRLPTTSTEETTTIDKSASNPGEGKYIKADGSVASYSSYMITNPITLLAGQRLFAKATAGSTQIFAKYTGSYTQFVPISGYYATTNREYTIDYTAEEDCQVVICGEKPRLSTYTIYTEVVENCAAESAVESLEERVTILENTEIINQYEGVDFSRKINAISHEHCYTKELIGNAYNRGIRLFACSHYQPSVARYPFSGGTTEYQDYKSITDVNNGDTSTITRQYTWSIPTIFEGAEQINTDTFPQIANAEHPFILGLGQHYNILGLLWGEPGHWLGNNDADGTFDLSTSEGRAAYNTWKGSHRLVTPEMLNALLQDEEKWQFGSAYAFGTINHNGNTKSVKTALDACPNIFKAVEIFNNGYSDSVNDTFKSAYDSVLSQGYKVWGTAVQDWQGDYGNSYHFDRGMNVLFMPEGFEQLTPEQIAKEGIKAYLAGRYYMSGIGTHTMRIFVNGNTITFRVSDLSTLKVITANGSRTEQGVDTISYKVNSGDKYVRFEATWNDGDFIYTNPLFVSSGE